MVYTVHRKQVSSQAIILAIRNIVQTLQSCMWNSQILPLNESHSIVVYFVSISLYNEILVISSNLPFWQTGVYLLMGEGCNWE